MSRAKQRTTEVEGQELRAGKRAEEKEPIADRLNAEVAPSLELGPQALADPRFAPSANLGPKAQALLGLQQTHGNAYVQRLVAGAEQPRQPIIQRQEEPEASTPGEGPSGFSLPPGSLLGAGLQLHLDPEVEAQIRAIQMMQEALDPLSVKPALLRVPLSVTMPPPAEAPGATAPPATAPAEPAPLVPPGAGPARPRAATGGDVVRAVMGVPAVDTALTTMRTRAMEGVGRFARRTSVEEKAAVVSVSALIGAGALAGVLSDEEGRRFVLDQLNGRVLPVPGVKGLSLEFNTAGDNLMLGMHLDVGALLPSSLGFGPSSPTPIGGPPTPQPFVPGQRAVQRAAEPAAPAVDEDLAERIPKASGSGSSLERDVQRRLEEGLEADLSQVRVHTDSEADRLARSVEAVAFTSGRDIFFRSGAYDPNSAEGMRLLAHEATHTMQQAAGPVASTPASGGVSISDPSDSFERAAEEVAEQVVEGQDSGSQGSLASPLAVWDSRDNQEDLPVQRQGTPGGAAPAAPAAAATWRMPFGLGSVTTHQAAREHFLGIYAHLDNLRTELEETERAEINDAIDETLSWSRALSEDGPITAEEARNLNWYTTDTEEVYNDKLGLVRRRVESGLSSFEGDPPDTSAEEAALAEQLHFAFIEGSEDQIGTIRDAIKKFQDWREKVENVLTWAKRAAGAVRAARTVAALERAIGGVQAVGNLAGKVRNVLTAARALATISGLDNQAVGEAQNSLNQFEAGMEAIDVTMTFAKGVPLLGTLWSSYYRPMINTCIRLMRIIARAEDVEGRRLALVEWWMEQQNRAPGRAPRIPQGLAQYFPGGQPVLNFMYAIMNEGSPAVTPAVEQFFLEHVDLFNVGQPEGEQLEVESESRWYNPFTWGAPDTLPRLMQWVQSNGRTVWSMLYGSLPPSL